ncbi:VOC family protein [Cohnella silvisoli]|uniref:VOC family protein n=1 Tax=Cohnella silvisoli TaxID=2873699 RepID=A0ABV1KRN3_9BACL|nr:VOC family protein [Cohnella silvisoli]MCD9022189.1 VOC family protein [Cohnella silvisoli]
MSNTPVSIQGITQLSIRVHDVAASVSFYNETLGLPLLFSQSNMALLDCNGIRLLLSIPEKPEFDHPSSIVYFRVENIEQAHQSLLASGVDFVSPPHKIAEFNGFTVWMAFFYDPDRNVHALTSEVPVA